MGTAIPILQMKGSVLKRIGHSAKKEPTVRK